MKPVGAQKLRRSLLLPLGDLILFYGSLALTLTARHVALVSSDTYFWTAVDFSPLFLVWSLDFYILDLYELRVMRDFVSLVRSLLLSGIIGWFMGANYFYLMSPYTGFTPKTHLLLAVVLFHCATLAWRRLWLALIKFQLLDLKLVFLGDESYIRALEEDIRQRDAGLSPAQWGWSRVDLVVADTQWAERNPAKAQEVFIMALQHKIPVVSVESFFESLSGRILPDHAGRLSWVLEHVLPRSNGTYSKIKRAIDFLVSACLLTAFGPFLAAIYLVVRVFDGAPALYGQKRVGLLGEEFVLWKFRTMALKADAAGPFTSALEEDPRISRLGRILRRFRLDELPQLWNVLKGEMSLVGPRPEWIKEVEVLEKELSNYHLRHLVMPGITGWAQVYYRATNNAQDSLEKLHFDLFYLKNISFALDVSIILKTIKRVFIKDSIILRQPIFSASGSSAKAQLPINVVLRDRRLGEIPETDRSPMAA